jgi:hypothetical protein
MINRTASRSSRRWVWIALIILALLHHDFWLWGDRSLLFGFLPVGLAYHMGFSLAAALLWVLAMKFAWPSELEAWAEAGPGEETNGNEERTTGKGGARQ